MQRQHAARAMVDDAEDHVHLAGGVGLAGYVDTPDLVSGDSMRNGVLCIAPQASDHQQIGAHSVADVGFRYRRLPCCAVQAVEGVRQLDRSGAGKVSLQPDDFVDNPLRFLVVPGGRRGPVCAARADRNR